MAGSSLFFVDLEPPEIRVPGNPPGDMEGTGGRETEKTAYRTLGGSTEAEAIAAESVGNEEWNEPSCSWVPTKRKSRWMVCLGVMSHSLPTAPANKKRKGDAIFFSSGRSGAILLPRGGLSPSSWTGFISPGNMQTGKHLEICGWIGLPLRKRCKALESGLDTS